MQCAVRGCKSNSSDVSGQYTFYEFPRDVNLRKQWMVNTGIEFVTRDTRICDLHFDLPCFYYNGTTKLKLLFKNAVPTIFPFTPGTLKAAIPTEIQEPKVVLERMDPLEESRHFVKPVSSTGQGPTLLIQPLTVLQENNPFLAICRACLATDCKMFPLTEEKLMWYGNLTELDLCEHLELPKWLCSECHHRLINVNKFRNKCLNARKLMLDVLDIHDVINLNTVKTVDRQANSLVSSLQKDHIETLDIYPELKTEPEVQDNNEFSNYECLEDDLNYNDTFDEKVIEKFNYELPIDHDYVIKDDNDEVINDDSDEVMEMDDDEVKNDDYIVPEVMIHRYLNEEDAKYITIPLKSDENRQEILSHVKKIENRMSKKKKNLLDKEVDGFTITSLSFEEQVEEFEKKRDCPDYKKYRHRCETCYISYMNLEQLDRHKIKHTDAYGLITCAVCKLHFQFKDNALNHLANNHLYKYSCSQCNFVTSNRFSAKQHKVYHKSGEYKCDHCPEIFTLRRVLIAHIRKKHPSPDIPEYFCEFCGRRWFRPHSLTLHIERAHCNDSQTVVENGPFCELCQLRFMNEEAYNNHMKCSFKHGTNESKVWVPRDPVTGKKKQKSYTLDYYKKCIKCDRQYGNQESYRKHLKKRHPECYERQRPVRNAGTAEGYICDQCGKSFKCDAHLQRHLVVHTREKAHRCDECGKCYPNPSTLKEHKLKHKGQYFVCDICNKPLSNYSNLLRHRFIHTGLRPYKCALCEKSFKSKLEQKTHMDHIHLQVPWPTRKRQRRADAPKRTPIAVVPEVPKRPRYKELIKNIEGPEM